MSGSAFDAALSTLLAAAVGTGVVAVGTYLTAVLDQPGVARLGSGWTGPARRAAMLLHQSRTVTERPDRELWALAGPLVVVLAVAAVLVVPLGATALVDAVDGILFFNAAISLVLVGVYLNGWGPNSVLSLIGGYRFTALFLSIQIPLALVLIGAAVPAQSLSLTDIANAQSGLWNVVQQPLGLPIFLIAGSGAAFWGPLAAPDAPELAGGTRAELSGGALLVWEWARYAVLYAVCVTAVAAFLGGGAGPLLPPAVWVAVKTVVLLTLVISIGHRLPRVRVETAVVFGWAVLIPLALLDVFQGAIVALIRA